MSIESVLTEFSNKQFGLDEAILKLLEAPELSLVGGQDVSSQSERNPFKRSGGMPLGPGPKGFLHVPAEVPWKCSKLGMYHYECRKTHPETGREHVRELKQSPTWKSDYNARYKQFLKHLRHGGARPEHHGGIVQFRSQALSDTDSSWLSAAQDHPGKIQRMVMNQSQPQQLAAGYEPSVVNLVTESVKFLV